VRAQRGDAEAHLAVQELVDFVWEQVSIHKSSTCSYDVVCHAVS
jgi:hypothetical protein